MFYKFTSASGSPDVVNTSSTTTTFMVGATDGFYVEAYGPVVRRADGDPEWSTTTSTATDTTNSDEQTGAASSTSASVLPTPTSSSEPASSGGGLSTGASAGIGVGVAIGCIIFISCIVAAYVIGKRRRAAAQAPDGPETPPHRDAIPVPNQTVELSGSGYKPWELPGGYQHVPEMDGHGYRSEMDANNHPIELQASEGQHGRYG
ncbi:hypothetical protein F5883DRAFT_712160 [Diaporthe sp. PMI_573]|nr:hypothetical protein F5883DRAFT_712160 [Diaporthaceae sp. PMI_573]